MVDRISQTRTTFSQPASQPTDFRYQPQVTTAQNLGDLFWAVTQTFRQLVDGFQASVREGKEFSDRFCGKENYDPVCRGIFGLIYGVGGGVTKATQNLKNGTAAIVVASDREQKIEAAGVSLASLGQIAGILIPGFSSSPSPSGFLPQAILAGKGGQMAFSMAADAVPLSIAVSEPIIASGGIALAMSSGEARGTDKSGDTKKKSEHAGEVIARLRKERGLTQQELARRIGLHKVYLGAIERGQYSGNKYFGAIEEFFEKPHGYLKTLPRATGWKRRYGLGVTHTQLFKGSEALRKIGREIKELRQQKGLTQAELSNRIGAGRSVVAQIENGLTPGTKHYPRLEEALGQREGHFASMRRTLETEARLAKGRTSKNIIDAEVLIGVSRQIGKPVVHIKTTPIDGKFVAMANDGSVYEITVVVKQVYKP